MAHEKIYSKKDNTNVMVLDWRFFLSSDYRTQEYANKSSSFKKHGVGSDAASSHGLMGRGDHGLPKVSPGPTMPYPSMPCGRASPETAISALRLFQLWPACRAGGLRPSPTPLDTPRRAPMATSSAWKLLFEKRLVVFTARASVETLPKLNSFCKRRD
jgi:hypothetical protein